jgi:signal transduction histidine kinase/CheY-like chemotaxis protein
MQTAREDRIREIFEEVARGSDLDRALSLIADQIAADLGAPTCKIWVVKRGDICDRCPLASICTNRQMCMHLAAASGAAIDKEYPRAPLALFSPSLLARGGALDFNDPNGTGERLFGLQHGAQNEGRDSYALYPLRGSSGTVGLIGVFNHRPIEQDEISKLRRLAPAAVAAVRMAELQSRCDSLRARLDKESATLQSLEQTAATRERELEDAAAQLTHVVAQMQVERELLLRESEQVYHRVEQLEGESRQLRERAESFADREQEVGRTYSEMAASFEANRRQIEEENAWLKDRVASLDHNVGEIIKQRETLLADLRERTRELEDLKAKLENGRGDLASARQALQDYQQKVSLLEEANAGLRDHNAAITESIDDLERTLRIAEDARTRLEQGRVSLEETVATLGAEVEQICRENSRISGENEQLVAEVERLRADNERLVTETKRLRTFNEQFSEQFVAEVDRLRGELTQMQNSTSRLKEDNNRLGALNRELSEERAAGGLRREELEQQNAELIEANTQMTDAVRRFESLTSRLEEGVQKLKDRAEAAEHARSDLEHRNRGLVEQNRRLVLDSQTRASFLANMSHELRTPMNAIIGFTSLLTEDRALQLSDRHRRSLERVSRNARDLLELINNVLDFSKIEAGRMDVYSEPADLRSLIERALAIVEPLKDGRPLSLRLEIEDGLPTLRTDRTKLQQVLINLLSNAIKFTEQGEVKVRAERASGQRVRIAVSDTGIGISEIDLPKIFEEFRQVGAHNRGARSGTGLGLAITRKLVDMLGGNITVSSKLGEGSVFALLLPVEIEGRAAPALEIDSVSADPDRTALVIDGDPASLYLMKKYLMESGYSVATTDDAGRGLEIARMAKPALICVDLDLPDGGLSLIEQMALDNESGLLVATSATSDGEQRAIGAGANLFLRKPVDRLALLEAVEQIERGRQSQILVVDDDPDALDLVVAMVEGNGYQIKTATTGREAFDSIAVTRPDCIVLDLMLPEMDGFEVVHRLSLNPELRAVPVILLTARDLSHEERRALDIGTARIIQKGNFSRDELLGEIKSMIGAAERDTATV